MRKQANQKPNKGSRPQKKPPRTETKWAEANPAVPPAPPVYALVLETVPSEPPQAKVLIENRRYDKEGGIEDIAQLSDTVVAHVSGSRSDYLRVFEGEPRVFPEDPREGGTVDDTAEMAPKPLKLETEKALSRHPVDGTRRGNWENPYFVLVTRKLAAENIVLTPAAEPPDIQICHEDLPKPTEQILGLYHTGTIDVQQTLPPPALRPPGTPPDVPTLVANIITDMQHPLPEALQLLLKPGRTLPIRTDGSLFPALMDRADVQDPADRKVWDTLHTCFVEARSSTDKSSFVFLTGTSGVGKSKIAVDIGKKDALVVTVPAKTAHDARSASSPYTLLFDRLESLRDQGTSKQRSRHNLQECATICFAHMVLSHLEVVTQVCETANEHGIQDKETILEIAIRAQQGAYTKLAGKIFGKSPIPTEPYEDRERLFKAFWALLERLRRVLPDTPIVIFHDEAQFLLSVHSCDKFFEGAWAHLKQNIQRNEQGTSEVASERPPKGPHSGLFYALICTIRYLGDGRFAESVGHVVAGTNMKMTLYMLNNESPAQGAAKHVNVTTCLSAINIQDWYASYLSDDAMGALQQFESSVLQTIQGRPLFASWFWRILVDYSSPDLSAAENVQQAVIRTLNETASDARKRVNKLWGESASQAVLCGLYYSLKAGHGGVVRIAATAFTQLEQAIVEGVLNIEATGPAVFIDLETEPATAQAILDVGNQSLANTNWEQDPVVIALTSRCIGFFGTAKVEGELLEDLFVWHVLKMCHKAGRPVPLKDILWGSQDGKYWPYALDDFTVDVKYGLRCPKGGGFLSAFEGENGEPRFDLILHHPPDAAASEDVIFPAMSSAQEFRKVGVQCKKRISSGLPDALRSLDMGKWYPDTMTKHGLVRTQPNREFVTAFRKHPEWFACPVRVVLHSKLFKPSVLCTAAYYNVAVVPEQPIVLTTMGVLRQFVCDGQVGNPHDLRNFTPTRVRYWHEPTEHREHPQTYLVNKSVFDEFNNLPEIGDTLTICCISEHRQRIYDAVKQRWLDMNLCRTRAFNITFPNVHDAIACQLQLNTATWQSLGVESVEVKK